MYKNYYDIILEITPEEQIEKACQMVNKQKVFSGFRKGRTPISLIITLSKTTPALQKNICAELAASAFPGEKLEDVLAARFEITDERISRIPV